MVATIIIVLNCFNISMCFKSSLAYPLWSHNSPLNPHDGMSGGMLLMRNWCSVIWFPIYKTLFCKLKWEFTVIRFLIEVKKNLTSKAHFAFVVAASEHLNDSEISMTSTSLPSVVSSINTLYGANRWLFESIGTFPKGPIKCLCVF